MGVLLESETTLGGSGIFATLTASHLGVPFILGSSVGIDSSGQVLVKAMRDLFHIKVPTVDSRETRRFLSLWYDDRRTRDLWISHDLPDAEAINLNDSVKRGIAFGQSCGRVLSEAKEHISGEWCLVPNGRFEDSAQLVEMCNRAVLLVLNPVDASVLTGQERAAREHGLLREIASDTGCHLILTAGRKGAKYVGPLESTSWITGPERDRVLGAGDILATSLFCRWSLEDHLIALTAAVAIAGDLGERAAPFGRFPSIVAVSSSYK
ncbi:MAG: carbohydrate kinase family protein [Bacteroidota bacterium]